MNQKEFAKAAGLTEGQLSHYLSGYRSPRSDILQRMALALDCSVDSLLSEKGERNSFKEVKNAIIHAKPFLNAEEKMQLIVLLSQNDEKQK